MSAHPSFKSDPELIALQDSIQGIRALIKNAKELAENYVRDRDQFVHLAGLGLMVEIIGHELTRATDHALVTLGEAKRLKVSESVDSLLRTLKTQLGTTKRSTRPSKKLRLPSTRSRLLRDSLLKRWCRARCC